MSDLMKAGLGLMATGVLGLGSMLAYLQACQWADWELIPAQRRSSVLGWQRRAPLCILLSAAVAVVGLALGVAAAVTAL